MRLYCVGSLKESYFADACDEYIKRLGAFCRPSVSEFRDDNALFSALSSLGGHKIALCVEGKQQSSEQFSEYLERVKNISSSVCFVIGGSDGLDEETKRLCDTRLSFSMMTFPHRLMRVILLEQIYRAFSIGANMKYHK